MALRIVCGVGKSDGFAGFVRSDLLGGRGRRQVGVDGEVVVQGGRRSRKSSGGDGE